ncbi:DUF6252 family protein [Mesonia maritima]|uniref:DUF5689 domain-containing protein n=1 Tax=Mesonia maritima TaxID=1793873 RepID=A0ABU1K406_9FLAO|nr:DUF6252 family protein [Mesonia maritima]MDR6300350.1 hypothetical protein [Mesonia maritima]
MRKNLLLNLVLVCLTVFGLQSCDNEPYEGLIGDDIPALESNFQVDIDGETFIADQAQASTQNGVTMITGIKNNGTTVSLLLNGSETGTFNLGQDGNSGSYAEMGQIPYIVDIDDTDATATVSEYNLEQGYISGVFSFTVTHTVDGENEEEVTETLELTNGQFTNIPLTSDVGPTPTNATFEVELDGELFTSDNAQASISNDGLEMAATNGNAQMTIQIFEASVGTFTLGSGAGAEGLILYDPDSTNENGPVYSSSEGTFTISEINMENNTVTGVFSGVLEEATGQTGDIEMTLGVFENIPVSTMQDTDFATAKIDGEDFTASLFPVVFQGNNVIVTFDNDLNSSIGLNFPADVSEGTYTITDSPNNYSATYIVDDNGSDIVYRSIAGSGEIVINSVQNDVVTGTFKFDAENDNGDSVSVTEGEFSIDIGF